MKKSMKHDNMISNNDESSTSPTYKSKKNSNSCNAKSPFTSTMKTSLQQVTSKLNTDPPGFDLNKHTFNSIKPKITKAVRGHSFSKYAKFSEKLTFLTPIRTQPFNPFVPIPPENIRKP